MHPMNEPLQLAPGEFASYPADGQRPYEFFEIYAGDSDGHLAALITGMTLSTYLPTGLRWRKRRKFVEAHGAAALEQTLQQHFPEARFIASHDGAMLEFSLPLPAGQIIPAHVEQRLLTETRASSFYDQLHNPDSRLIGELQHRLHLVSVGTEWQKYFHNKP